jgi:hypothetical protein
MKCRAHVAFRFDESNLAFRDRTGVRDGRQLAIVQVNLPAGSREMLKQIQADYPERTCFMSDESGQWHLHPGQYSSLSVGDVEECRKTLRDCVRSMRRSCTC